MSYKTVRNAALNLALGAVAAGVISSTAVADTVTLDLLVSNNPANVARAEQLAADFETLNPDIKIEIETRPGGGEGDNIVKTRLATGVMSDIFFYNSGSLFQAINPERNLVDLSDEPYQADFLDSFKNVVTANGKTYGVPGEPAMGGGILYNRKIYSDLGLSVPKTWDEFMANNQVIKEAGKTAVIQTYKDTWTSQLFVLADYHNVHSAEPDFAEMYTANKAKYATTPAAMNGFKRLESVFKAGYLNEDFGAAGFTDGLRMLASGEGAHYPMLTFALGAIAKNHPDQLQDIGFFAQPGDDSDKNGLTLWMPAAYYIPKNSDNIDEAKLFLAFVASTAGCESQNVAVGATGPSVIMGCTLPDDVPPGVADMLPYVAEGGMATPALEFLSPIKGPSLEQITVEVGSGFRSAEDAAAMYDQDVRKQARQLGLDGW